MSLKVGIEKYIKTFRGAKGRRKHSCIIISKIFLKKITRKH